jgi:hypothetical protein
MFFEYSEILNGDEIEDLQKMGFDFGRFVSDLQY